jgi:hypothetical protein
MEAEDSEGILGLVRKALAVVSFRQGTRFFARDISGPTRKQENVTRPANVLWPKNDK